MWFSNWLLEAESGIRFDCVSLNVRVRGEAADVVVLHESSTFLLFQPGGATTTCFTIAERKI